MTTKVTDKEYVACFRMTGKSKKSKDDDEQGVRQGVQQKFQLKDDDVEYPRTWKREKKEKKYKIRPNDEDDEDDKDDKEE